jgi:hypothetical protein
VRYLLLVLVVALVCAAPAEAKAPPVKVSLTLGGLAPEVKQALRVLRRAVDDEYVRRLRGITADSPPDIDRWFWNEWWMRRLDLVMVRDYLAGP